MIKIFISKYLYLKALKKKCISVKLLQMVVLSFAKGNVSIETWKMSLICYLKETLKLKQTSIYIHASTLLFFLSYDKN